jgi:uncharacterized membrane-anchored protein YhcB (DUF1043 family)
MPIKLFSIIVPLGIMTAFFAEGTELVTVNWSNLSALAALIGVLGFIVVYLIPSMLKQQAINQTESSKLQAEQAKSFAAASQAQTESATKAMAQAATESAKAVAQATGEASKLASDMHREFVVTLDKMAARYDANMQAMLSTMQGMHQTCPASHEYLARHSISNGK